MAQWRTLVRALAPGAAVVSALVAASCLFGSDALGSWLLREDRQARARRGWLAAERRARLAADYIDICRAAGL
jgi:hypothetical protein